jgi:hypothetical protein
MLEPTPRSSTGYYRHIVTLLCSHRPHFTFEGSTDPQVPRFALLDDHTGVITKLLRAIVGRWKPNHPVTPV